MEDSVTTDQVPRSDDGHTFPANGHAPDHLHDHDDDHDHVVRRTFPATGVVRFASPAERI